MKIFKIALTLLALSSFSVAQMRISAGADMNTIGIELEKTYNKKFYSISGIGTNTDGMDYKMGVGVKISMFAISSAYVLSTSSLGEFHTIDTRAKINIGSFMGSNFYGIAGYLAKIDRDTPVVSTDGKSTAFLDNQNQLNVGVGMYKEYGKKFYTNFGMLFDVLEDAQEGKFNGIFILKVGYKI